ncbi:MAG TPA: TRAM domain-containing protein [Chthoniobacteraceae bacterium]|nr:TRAM domain-containing protein [Chthoniobacteraceae bacterium]
MENKLLYLTIDDIAFGGSGVGRSDGLAVFVPYTIPGEKVEAVVVRRKKKFAQAALVELESASPDRVEAPCPYFTRCGGCAYQHIAYERQLEIKSAQVGQTLERIGKLASVPMRPMIPSPQPYGYRNRIRVHASGGKVGFYAPDGHHLVDIRECLLASPEVNRQLTALRRRPVPERDYTVAERQNRFFDQTNDAVAELMAERIGELLTPGGRLIDAYSGAGFFARRLGEPYEAVVGIEENLFAVERARSVAHPRETYLAGDVADHLPGLFSEGEPTPTSLILDPPAIGVSRKVVETLLALPETARPREIVYVSCDPATLARDLALLAPVYAVEEVTPLDMFPQTAEIEVVTLLRPRP